MNAEAITLVVFFSIVFLLAQIRFFRRLIRLKKRYDNLPGAMILAAAEIFGCCLGGCCEASVLDEPTEQELVDARRKALKKKKAKIQQTKSAENLREPDSLSQEEEIRRVTELVSSKQKTSLQWISAVTMIPIESVIEILTADPNFIVEDDYVLIQKIPTKSESTMTEDRIVSAQELREIKEKLAQGICPICSTPFEPSHEFCSNCGYVLK